MSERIKTDRMRLKTEERPFRMLKVFLIETPEIPHNSVFRLDACPETREDFGAGILGTLGRDQQPSLDGYITGRELDRSTVCLALDKTPAGTGIGSRAPVS